MFKTLGLYRASSTTSQPPKPAALSVLRAVPAPSQGQDGLRALEGISGLQRLPPLHAACLDADHVLVAILGCEVADPGGLLGPRVPHHNVSQVVADDGEDGLAALDDLDWLTGALGGRVDAICLARDGDGCRLCLDLCRVDLVDVLGGVKAFDRDLGDILPCITLAPSRLSHCHRTPSPRRRLSTHINPQISVGQHLELPRLVILVRDDQRGGQVAPL
jgi:hypothetical protein